MTRETEFATAFVELAEAMVSGRDVVDFLHLLCCHSATLLDVTAAGVMLADENNRLLAVAASDEDTHLLGMFSLQHEEGPCLEAYRTGRREQISAVAALERWPNYARVTMAHGYQWMCGIPLRQGTETVGALSLFRAAATPLPDAELRLAQALADVATVSLLQRRETAEARRLAAHLQVALSSRVLIEQAKGALAERLGITLDEAFAHLRRQSRDTNRKLHDIAHEIVCGKGK